MRTLVIGTSHTVALRQGWDLLAPQDRPDGLEVEFYAMGHREITTCGLDEAGTYGPMDRFAGQDNHTDALRLSSRLTPTGRVNPQDFDTVLMVGGSTGVTGVLRILAHCDVDGVLVTGKRPCRLSETNFQRICTFLAQQVVPDPAWRRYAHKDLILVPEPLLFEKLFDPDVSGTLATSLAEVFAQGDGVAGLIEAAFQRVRQVVQENSDFHYPGQPPETIGAQGCLSRDAFSRGAKLMNFQDEYPSTDFSHANGEYGREYWKHVLGQGWDRRKPQDGNS